MCFVELIKGVILKEILFVFKECFLKIFFWCKNFIVFKDFFCKKYKVLEIKKWLKKVKGIILVIVVMFVKYNNLLEWFFFLFKSLWIL